MIFICRFFRFIDPLYEQVLPELVTHVPKHGSFAQWKNGPVIKRNKARAINGDAFTVVLKT